MFSRSTACVYATERTQEKMTKSREKTNGLKSIRWNERSRITKNDKALTLIYNFHRFFFFLSPRKKRYIRCNNKYIVTNFASFAVIFFLLFCCSRCCYHILCLLIEQLCYYFVFLSFSFYMFCVEFSLSVAPSFVRLWVFGEQLKCQAMYLPLNFYLNRKVVNGNYMRITHQIQRTHDIKNKGIENVNRHQTVLFSSMLYHWLMNTRAFYTSLSSNTSMCVHQENE